MKGNFGKKFLSLFLSAVMVLGMLPTTAVAFTLDDIQDFIDEIPEGGSGELEFEGNIDSNGSHPVAVEFTSGDSITYPSLEEAIAAAQNGDTIELVKDIVLEESVIFPADKRLILDLNGHTISQTKKQTENYQMILNDGDLTIMDSEDGGKISYTDSGNGGEYNSNTITNRGTLTLMSGIVENLSSATVAANGYPYAIDSSIWGPAAEVNTIIKGGKVYCANYSAIRVRGDSTTEAVNCTVNDGEIVGTIEVQDSGGAASKGKLTINGGKLSNSGTANVLFVFGNGTATAMKIEITGGEFTGNVTVRDSIGDDFNEEFIVGGIFETDVSDFVANGYAALQNFDNQYVVGVEPEAKVTNLGDMLVPGGSYMVYNDLGDYASASNSADMPLPFIMEYVAVESPEEGAASPYADWYGDFVISFTGIESGRFSGDDCYLAGHYGSFGWVKVPVDGLTIENNVRYPVMLSTMGNGQKYEYICGGVDTFLCALYLTPEVLEANPDMQVSLELCVVDNSAGSQKAQEALATVNSPYTYLSAVEVFECDDFAVVAKPPIVIPDNIVENIVGKNDGATENVVKDIVNNIKSNEALNDVYYDPIKEHSDIEELVVTLVDMAISEGVPTNITFNVEPKDANGDKVSNPDEPITFRLPIPNTNKTHAKVYHDDTLLGTYEIKGSYDGKYVEVTSESFSEFGVELVGVSSGDAEINGVGYATLEEAVAAAGSNDTITLLRNVAVSKTLVLPSRITLTIDGNGHKITPANDFNAGGHGAVLVLSGYDAAYNVNNNYTIKNLTFEGFSNLTRVVRANFSNAVIEECVFESNSTSDSIISSSYANLTVKDCTFNNNTVAFSVLNIGYDVSSGTELAAKITGNSFSGNNAAIAVVYLATSGDVNGNYFTSNTHTGDNANAAAVLAGPYTGSMEYSVDITENAFVNAMSKNGTALPAVFAEDWSNLGSTTAFDLSANYWNGEKPTESVAYKTSGSNPAVKLDSYYTTYDGTLSDKITIATNVAEVNGVGYSTLAYAIAAANGGTVEILDDIYESLSGIENVILTTNVAGGVTVTNTFAEDEWIAFNNVTLKSGVTLIMPNVLINGAKTYGSVNIIEGTLMAGTETKTTTYYQYNDAKTTVQNGGKIIVSGDTVLRNNYNTDSGIFIYGDDNDTTVEYSSGLYSGGYIGAYSGTFYAENAVVNTGDLRLDYHDIKNGQVKGEEPDKYAPINAQFVNSAVSVMNQLRLYKDAHLNLNGSTVHAGLLQVRAQALPIVDVDTNSSLTADAVEVVTGALLDASLNADGTVSFKPMVAKIGNKTYSDLQVAIDAANGEEVVLLNPITVAKGESLTIDLKGQTVTHSISEKPTKSFAMITNKGTLTITDSVGGGKLSLSYSGDSFGYGIGLYTISNEGGTLDIENGRIENLTTVTGSMYDAIDNNSTLGDTILNISGGTVSCGYLGIRQFANSITHKNVVNVTGGTVIGGNSSIWTQNPGSAQPKADIAISGGIFEGRILLGESTGFETAVSGGTFDTDVSAICSDGYTAKANGDGTYGIVVDPTYGKAAKIGEQYYSTLTEALNAAQTGDIITLLTDIEISATTNLSKSITIDGNGHKITQAAGFMANGANVVFDIFGNATVTFQNLTFDGIQNVGVMRTVNANVVIDKCEVQNCMQTVSQGLLRLACGNATITNSTFLNNNCKMVITFGYDAANDADVLLIDECTFEGNTCSDTAVVYFADGDYGKVTNSKFINNSISATGNSATLYMGWGSGFEVSRCLFKGNQVTTSHTTTKRFASAIFADGCKIENNVFLDNTAIRNGEAMNTVVAVAAYYGAASVSSNYWNGGEPAFTVEYSRNNVEAEDYYAYYNAETGELSKLIEISYVAKVGVTYFTTLETAFAAAQNGDIITLLTDITTSDEIVNTKTVTLDLNGKTITGMDNGTASFGLITNKGTLTIKDSDSANGGKITLTAANNRGWNAYSSVISNTVGGKLIVESGTIEHLGGTDMAYGIDNLTNGKGTYAETIINGGTVKSTYRAIRQFLNGIEAQNILTVNGGTVEGTNKSIWMQDPSTNANTGTLNVGENAVLKGDVYLFVTAGSTEWPVEVSIAAAALNDDSEVLTGNVPSGYELQNNNGIYGVAKVTYVAMIGEVGYATLQDAIDAAQAGDTITLLTDLTIESDLNNAGKGYFNIDADDKIIIDLNGKTITATDKSAGNFILFYNFGELTMKDSSDTKSGAIELTATIDRQFAAQSTIIMNRGGKLTIESGKYIHHGGDSMAYAVENNANSFGDAYLYVKGGEIISENYIGIRMRMENPNLNGDPGNGINYIEVTGGYIYGANRGIWGQKSSSANEKMGELTMAGGTVENNRADRGAIQFDTDSHEAQNVKAQISGTAIVKGTLMGSDDEFVVSGGTFTVAVPEKFCAEGYIPMQNTDGTYGVKVGAYIAEIDDVKYENIAQIVDAVKAKSEAGEDVTVKFLSDAEITDYKAFDYGAGNITFTADAPVTITLKKDFDFAEGNNITIKVEKNVTLNVYDNAGGIYVYYGPGMLIEGTITGGQNWGCLYLAYGEHTIAKNGTVSIGRTHLAWTKLTVNGKIDSNYLLVEDSEVIFNGASVDADYITDTNNGGLRYGASDISIINGSNINASTVELKHAESVMVIDLTSSITAKAVQGVGTIKVDATNFAGTAVQVITGDMTNFTGAIEVVGNELVIAEQTADGLVIKAAIAKVGNVKYESLQDAINAAQDGDTIQLLPGTIDEAVVHTCNKSITIVGAENYGTKMTGGLHLGVDNSQNNGKTVTIKGIAFEGKGILTAGIGNVIIENNKFTNINDYVATHASAVQNAISVIGKNITATVTGNVIENVTAGKGSGIHLRDVENATVEKNTVTNTHGNAITINPTTDSQGTIIVKDNTLSTWGTSGEGRAIRISGGNTVNFNGNVMTTEDAPEEFAKVTDATVVDASENYWNGKDPTSFAAWDSDLTAAPAQLLKSYYTDAEKTNLVTLAQPVAKVGNQYYADLQTAIYAANGNTVELLVPITVAAGETMTIDLKGQSVTHVKECTESYQMINNKGTLIINDSVGGGKLSFKDTSEGDPTFGWGSYTIRNEGTLIINGGKIEHAGEQNPGKGEPNVHMYCAIFQYCGSTTINNGTISTPTYRSVRLWKGEMTINDGAFEGQVWVQCVDDSAKLTINGGTFAPRGNDGSSVFVENASKIAELSVTGGTFETKIGCSDADALAGAIKGGKFSESAKNNTNATLIAEGFEFSGEANADGYYGIVEKAEEEPLLAVTGRSLLLEDIVQIKYYFGFDPAIESSITASGMYVWDNETDAEALNFANSIWHTNEARDEGTYQGNYEYSFRSGGIAAKEMGDLQYVVGYIVIDGKTHYSAVETYSPKTWCQNKKNDTKEKLIAAALMNYGAAAQIYFNYNTENLMNEGFEAYTFTDDQLTNTSRIKGTGVNGFEENGISMILDGAVQYKVYYKAAGLAGKSGFGIEYQIGNGTVQTVEGFEKRGNEYFVKVEGIAAKNLDEIVTIKPFYTENGQRVYGAESTFCAEVWVYNKMSSTKTDEDSLKDKAFAPALGNYIYCVNLRFSK